MVTSVAAPSHLCRDAPIFPVANPAEATFGFGGFIGDGRLQGHLKVPRLVSTLQFVSSSLVPLS